MLRFRIGQSWKREPQGGPHDSFGLELDGVDLLSQASEEPLAQVVPELISAVHALAREGAECAQVSLHEAHVELVFWREGDDAILSIVSLKRPAQLARPPVRVDLSDLSEAAARCGRAWVNDVAEAAPSVTKAAARKALLKKSSALEGASPKPVRRSHRQSGYGYEQFSQRPGQTGFRLVDADDRLLSFDRKSAWSLPSLLCGGEVHLRLSASKVISVRGAPFLLALEASRQATDLARAIESREKDFTLPLFGGAAVLEVSLERKEARLQQERFALPPDALARGLFELGVNMGFAITHRNRAQNANPYLVGLLERCREGLSALRPDFAPAGDARAAQAKAAPSAADQRPLGHAGELRRLRFEALWEKTRLASEEPGRLLLGKQGPIFSSSALACGFTRKGDLQFRHVATHGVAVADSGEVLCATADRVMAFRGKEKSARWLRDHDGVPIGPELYRTGELLIALTSSKGALAFSQVTGREVWRIAPPRTQQVHFTVQGHRALLTTDSGSLYGLDLADGQIRYRMRGALPLVTPALPWGRKMVSVLSRGNATALFAADAHSGQIHWTKELQLSAPSHPLAVRSRVYLAGERDGQTVLLCLGGNGVPAWERVLPLKPGRLQIIAAGGPVVVSDRTGAAVLVGLTGELEWRVGSAGEELPCSIAPQLKRQVLVLPGETVRAVDPKGGRVLAEVEAGLGLCDLKVDPRLNLYLLDEDGTLKAYRLSSHFAVV